MGCSVHALELCAEFWPGSQTAGKKVLQQKEPDELAENWTLILDV